jgi:peptide/nickel transport system substrate-binding protein
MEGSQRHLAHPSSSRALALFTIGALLLAACSATQSPSGSASATAGGGSTAPSGSASATVPTNTFTLAIQSDPQSLDPAAATDLPGRSVMVNLYESLVRYEGSPPTPVPNIAESITGSSDSKTFTVKLRSGVTFHDGSPVDAAAVVFSMDRVLTIGKGGANSFKGVLQPGDTKAVDSTTVQFNLSSPEAFFPATLAFFFIVNPAVIKANEDPSGPYGANGDYGEKYLQTHDAGSGPYEMTSRTPNAEIDMQAYPQYWRGWKSNQYGKFIVKLANEPASVGLLMTQGQVDGIYENYPTTVFDQLSQASNVTVYTNLGIKPFYIFMNNMKKPLDNVKVRQAIAYAFDYQQALQIAPGAVRLPGPLPDGMWGALSAPAYDTNIDKAKSLLAEAGVQPGTVTLDFGSLGGPASVQTKIGLLLQAQLAKIGITVNITNYAWADILAQSTKPETTKAFYAIQLAADYADPDALLYQGWDSAGHGSWSGMQWYTSSQVDNLILQGRTTQDQNQRQQIYQQIQQQIVSDSPCVFMMNLPIQVALNKSVGGYKFVVAYYNYQVYNLFKQG